MISVIDCHDRYEIVRLIAEGGMGAVFEAKKIGEAGFEKVVALKMLLPKYSADPVFIGNFIREAKLVANLIHENIVQIYQLSRCPEGYYFVMEFVDGISLHDFVEFHRRVGRRLPVNLAVFIASRAARALAYAHSRRGADGVPLGIVHCDICPRNILINTEGVPKITDFGIARVATAGAAADGKVTGKVAFMAPEQAASGTVDFRADVYALGMVLFLLLSDHPARNLRQPLTGIVEDVRHNRIEWEQLPADLPEELRALLHRMLLADPPARCSDTAELATELEYFIYKDGYGPTIVTLADYMRKLMPGRFGAEPTSDAGTPELDRTVVLDHQP